MILYLFSCLANGQLLRVSLETMLIWWNIAKLEKLFHSAVAVSFIRQPETRAELTSLQHTAQLHARVPGRIL
jgi:hypothetical protein